MSTTEVAVIVTDIGTGALVDSAGVSISDGICYVFDSIDAAISFATERTTALDSLRCELFDHRGRAVAPLTVIKNPKHAADEDGISSTTKIALGYALLLLCFVFAALEWNTSRSGFFGVIAVFLFASAGRMLYWGYASRRR